MNTHVHLVSYMSNLSLTKVQEMIWRHSKAITLILISKPSLMSVFRSVGNSVQLGNNPDSLPAAVVLSRVQGEGKFNSISFV